MIDRCEAKVGSHPAFQLTASVTWTTELISILDIMYYSQSAGLFLMGYIR